MRTLVVLLAAAAALFAEVTVSIETTTGDTVRGRVAVTSIPMITGFGKVDVAIDGIETVTFGSPDVVRLKDGSLVQGTLQLDELAVESSFGRITLKRASLRKLTVLGAEGATAQGESYPIRIRRVYKAGDRWTVSGMVSRASKRPNFSRDGTWQVVETHDVLDFAGQVLVVEVDAVGRMTRAECVVERCEGKGAQGDIQLPQGTILWVSLVKGEPRIADKNDRVLNNDCIAEFLPVESSTPHSDDEVFGSTTSRRDGESWPVSRVLLADQLHGAFGRLQIDPKEVSGTVSLMGIAEMNGVKCLAMRLECRVANFGAARDFSELSGELTSSEEFVLPIDERLPIASDVMTMHIVVKRESNREETMDFFRSITRRRIDGAGPVATSPLIEPLAEEAAALEALRRSPTQGNREALARIRATHAVAMLELARKRGAGEGADAEKRAIALDLALRYAHSAKELVPTSALYWSLLAQAYAENADNETALTMAHDAAAKASSLAPDDNRVRLLLGQILFREGFYASALDEFERAVSNDRSLAVPDLLAVMTVAYTLDCLAWRGEEFMARLVEADPEAHTARMAMAILQHHQGKDKQAYAELAKVAGSPTAGQRELDYAVKLAGEWRREAPLPSGK